LAGRHAIDGAFVLVDLLKADAADFGQALAADAEFFAALAQLPADAHVNAMIDPTRDQGPFPTHVR
jgi:hypothetical protein